MVAATIALADGPVIPTFGTTSKCVKDNDTFCTDWLKTNWSPVLKPALIQHIELTLIALVIGFAISFTLAVVAHRQRWLAAPVTFLGSLLYTVPSLAAFEILVPITGINRLTVELALVSYTLLILFTNTLAGLAGVSPEVLDAARGAGLTDGQILRKVELPLALPTIIAGIRVAAVTLVSLVTVVAFVLPQGLGKPIFDALNKGNFNTEFIAAGTLCVLLALVADALLAGSQRLVTPWASARRSR
ncbi:ABC transporter permease [uncultured Jatrophihabitans sp.]|uniref:ABC transporter permease n=1 Tax=uncultured Jatrophihabitans sp. TaxID=1610747 RepID=UPI0035C9E531